MTLCETLRYLAASRHQAPKTNSHQEHSQQQENQTTKPQNPHKNHRPSTLTDQPTATGANSQHQHQPPPIPNSNQDAERLSQIRQHHQHRTKTTISTRAQTNTMPTNNNQRRPKFIYLPHHLVCPWRTVMDDEQSCKQQPSIMYQSIGLSTTSTHSRKPTNS
jgi:hypothetical protein